MNKSEPAIVFLEEKELLEGLLQITGNNLGAAHSLLDRVIDKTREEFAATLREMQNNIGPELRNARRRATYRLKKSVGRYPGLRSEGMALHHLVAGWDKRAERALKILLQFGIDPHSSVNAAYIPRYVRHTPHADMPNARAHSTIHTNDYHDNVFVILREVAMMPGATKADVEKALREIAVSLQSGIFPIDEKIERS